MIWEELTAELREAFDWGPEVTPPEGVPPVSGPDPDLQGTTTRVAPVSGPDPEDDDDPVELVLADEEDDDDPAHDVLELPDEEDDEDPTEPGAPAPREVSDVQKKALSLTRARGVKDFIQNYSRLLLLSGLDHKIISKHLKDIHTARRQLAAISQKGNLVSDEGKLNLSGDAGNILKDLVYDFGLGNKAFDIKTHFAELVDKTEQARLGGQEDEDYLAATQRGSRKGKGRPTEPSTSRPEETPAAPEPSRAPDKPERPELTRRERRRLDQLRSGEEAFEVAPWVKGGRGEIPAQAIMDLDLEDAEHEREIADYLREKGYAITEAKIKACAALLKEHRQLKRWKKLASIT